MPETARPLRRSLGNHSGAVATALALLLLLDSAPAGTAAIRFLEASQARRSRMFAVPAQCSICNDTDSQGLTDDLVLELRQSILRQPAADSHADSHEDAAADSLDPAALFERYLPSIRTILSEYWGIPLFAPTGGVAFMLARRRKDDSESEPEFPRWCRRDKRSRLQRLLDC